MTSQLFLLVICHSSVSRIGSEHSGVPTEVWQLQMRFLFCTVIKYLCEVGNQKLSDDKMQVNRCSSDRYILYLCCLKEIRTCHTLEKLNLIAKAWDAGYFIGMARMKNQFNTLLVCVCVCMCSHSPVQRHPNLAPIKVCDQKFSIILYFDLPPETAVNKRVAVHRVVYCIYSKTPI